MPYLLLICVFIVNFAAHAQTLPPPVTDEPGATVWNEPSPASETEWTIWKDEHFEISYPPKWYVSPPQNANELVLFSSTFETHDDHIQELMIIYKLSGAFTGTTTALEQNTRTWVSGAAPEAKFISSRSLRINTFDAVELTFTGTFGEGTKNKVIVFSTGQAVYMFDMLYEASASEKHEAIFADMIKTIVVH